MKMPESAAGTERAFGWKAYSVSRADKEPLLRFIVEALEMRGCQVLHASEPNRAPFYIVFETPSGDRCGVLAYAFFANSELTQNRPDDEHRFQIKYGSKLTGVLEVAVDPNALITTIFLGIDTQREIFIAADPLMHNPSPMSRSVEFKSQNVTEILSKGWIAWERDRRPPKTKTRPTPILDEDARIEVLVGGRKHRLFDLIQLEQISRGREPGERHPVADKLLMPSKPKISGASHKLLDELSIPSEALFDLIEGASRLKMAVRGWVAESHLETTLQKVRGVTECRRIEAEGKPDITLRWKGSPPILIECKNVLRKTNAAGRARVDFQRTRASKDNPCTRYYQPSDFPVLAACLHPVREKWEFSFALTDELAPHAKCPGRIASNVVVNEPNFSARPEAVFDKLVSRMSP
jgi:hypothetical protein